MILALVLLAAVCALPFISPARRLPLGQRTAKNPRDGPGKINSLEFADDLDLFALCLAAGLPLTHAVRAVADAAGSSTKAEWRRAGSLMALGIGADRAFADSESLTGFDELSRMLRRSSSSGSSLVQGLRQLAIRLREQASDDAVARAERAGVLISLPLTGCFLPAFLVLGLAPLLYSLFTHLP
ncbi:type II secretion system F family protein [Corynebacterium tapiri]|uniref:Type II secretion system F family protein n=1 Tax=Corynebacterium tapiri TaxID=1448266 RepID=A0A5C4U529_9CORY|nr:type II secretion system F family protein [Corynebacterium tapiri]TNL97349.1 type II secretion system F family protein [Corynebacterium tapiri]